MLPLVVFDVGLDGCVEGDAIGGSRGFLATGTANTPSLAEAFEANPNFRRAVTEILQGGPPQTFETTLGSATFRMTASSRIDEAGRPTGVRFLGLDVTEARATRSALSARDEQLRLLVDTALDAVITCDVSSHIVDWNAGAERLFGWTRDEAIGRRLTETVIPPDLRAAHDAGMKRFLEHGTGPVLGQRIEIEAVDRDDRRFPIELSINPIPTPAGMLFSAFLRDISDRLEGARRLASSEYRLRSAMTAMRAGAFDLQIDPEGRVVDSDVDERCVELLGDDATVHPAARARVHPDDRELVARAWHAHLTREEGRYEIEYRVVDDHGNVDWRRDLGMLVEIGDEKDPPPIPGRPQASRRMIGVVTDESATHALTESLEAARKLEAVGQVASSFAHDLNNVLAAVNGHASLAATVTDLPDRAVSHLETIRDAVTRGRALTQNMLMLGRPGRARRDQVDPAASIRETAQFAAPILGERIALDLQIEPELPRIECDAGQFQQALLNILINARDAMEGRGRIRIRAHRIGERDERGRPMIAIEIEDDGPGMLPEVQKSAVRPFFTTKGSRGTGLGLAMVDAFTREGGGRLEIVVPDGGGTTIRMGLPAARGVASNPPSEPGKSSKAAAPDADMTDPAAAHVLVIEDHPLLRPMLVEALSNAGYAAEGAPNGTEAAAIVARTPPAVIVADVNLPGEPGDEVAARLRSSLEHEVPVLFITGNADFRPPPWSNVGILRKPFELHELSDRVASMLGGETP